MIYLKINKRTQKVSGKVTEAEKIYWENTMPGVFKFVPVEEPKAPAKPKFAKGTRKGKVEKRNPEKDRGENS